MVTFNGDFRWGLGDYRAWRKGIGSLKQPTVELWLSWGGGQDLRRQSGGAG